MEVQINLQIILTANIIVFLNSIVKTHLVHHKVPILTQHPILNLKNNYQGESHSNQWTELVNNKFSSRLNHQISKLISHSSNINNIIPANKLIAALEWCLVHQVQLGSKVVVQLSHSLNKSMIKSLETVWYFL